MRGSRLRSAPLRAHMRALIRMLAAAVALAMTTGTAFAVMGKTTTDVALRRAPTAQAELILNLSQGTLVNVGGCLRGWCAVSWNEYGGYVRESALQFRSTPASGPPAIPVYPPYPYKAGHYPTADAYYDLPPYAATNPSFYRWRHFLTAQERNRYRYMPHIFRGYTGYRDDTVGSYVSSTGWSVNQSHPVLRRRQSPVRLRQNQGPKRQRYHRHPLHQNQAPQRQRYHRHPLHQNRAPKRQRYHRHPLHQNRAPQRQRYHRHPLHQNRAPQRQRYHPQDRALKRPKEHSAAPSTNYATRPKAGASNARFSVNQFITRRMNASDRSMTLSSREISQLHTQSSTPAAFSA